MASRADRGRPGHRRSALNVVALTALVLCAVVSCGPALGRNTSRLEPLTASGTLEAESVVLYPEIGGRVIELGVSEGQELEAGALIAQLDDAIWRAQLAQAEAALISARAQLAQLEAGSQPEVIVAAQAELKETQAKRDQAYQAWQYALLMCQDPQQLAAQIVEAQAELAVAEEEIVQQEAQLSQRTVSRDRYHYPQREWHFLNYLTTAAQEALEAARVKRNGAATHLDNLIDMRDRPLALNAEAHAAHAQYLVAEAEVLQKEAALQAIQAGSGQRELEVARAQVALAAARVHTAEVYLEQTTVVAPLSGVVSDLSLHRGELASPAAPLAVISNMGRMTLRVYVPEGSLSRVYLGQEAHVRVDAYPGQIFQGNVAFISSEAEFAPRSITSQEERAKMMFAVDIRVPNGGDPAQGGRPRLKPGLPADAEFIEERNTL